MGTMGRFGSLGNIWNDSPQDQAANAIESAGYAEGVDPSFVTTQLGNMGISTKGANAGYLTGVVAPAAAGLAEAGRREQFAKAEAAKTTAAPAVAAMKPPSMMG